MPTPIRVLVTGFEPFGEFTTNASQAVVEQIAGYPGSIDDATEVQLHTDVLPVAGGVAAARLRDLLDRLSPDVVIALGVARVEQITVERVAVNLCDYRIPDRDGRVRVDEPVAPDGPVAYFSTLPVRRIVERCLAEGIPAGLSLSAGSYLCNEVFFTLRHWQASGPATPDLYLDIPVAAPSVTMPTHGHPGSGLPGDGRRAAMLGGFIHLPVLPQEAARLARPTPSMALADQVRAVRLAIDVTAAVLTGTDACA